MKLQFTFYALKCKKVKLMIEKWGVNNIVVREIEWIWGEFIRRKIL
jgi:hypothetical protein